MPQGLELNGWMLCPRCRRTFTPLHSVCSRAFGSLEVSIILLGPQLCYRRRICTCMSLLVYGFVLVDRVCSVEPFNFPFCLQFVNLFIVGYGPYFYVCVLIFWFGVSWMRRSVLYCDRYSGFMQVCGKFIYQWVEWIYGLVYGVQVVHPEIGDQNVV